MQTHIQSIVHKNGWSASTNHQTYKIKKQVILKIGEKEHIKNRASTKQKNKCGVNQNC